MHPLVTSALIGLGGNLLGGLSGLFGGGGLSPRKKAAMEYEMQSGLQRQSFALAEQYRRKPIQVRDEAFVAGFNPLTVLGAGGLGSQTVNPAIPPAPVMSSASQSNVIGDLIRGVGTGLQQVMNAPIEAATREREARLLDLQIATAERRLNNENLSRMFFGMLGPSGFKPASQRRVTRSPRRDVARPALSTTLPSSYADGVRVGETGTRPPPIPSSYGQTAGQVVPGSPYARQEHPDRGMPTSVPFTERDGNIVLQTSPGAPELEVMLGTEIAGFTEGHEPGYVPGTFGRNLGTLARQLPDVARDVAGLKTPNNYGTKPMERSDTGKRRKEEWMRRGTGLTASERRRVNWLITNRNMSHEEAYAAVKGRRP